MNLKIDIKNIIVNQHSSLKDHGLISRELQVPLDSNKIIVISGVRRCGKTSLLKLIRRALINGGTSLKNTLFLSFDDERLMLETSELDLILQAYQELYPDLDFGQCYFFFDEIQNVNNWEMFIRRIYDNISKNIFITGSNSKQLGSEIASGLRGRTLRYELFPLSFHEYLRFRNITTNYYGDKNRSVILNAFHQYMAEGGFPETIDKDPEMQLRILSDYFQVLLFRDIIERYNVTRISAMKYYTKKLFGNLGKPFSVNKTYNELRSRGIRIDKGALYDILEYIEAAYLGLRLYRFDYSIVNREMGDKKIYIIDNGLINSITFQFSGNYGALLENMAFIWLKQKYGENLFYYFKKHECDFVIFDRDKARHCIQVSYDISNQATLERELNGLKAAMKYFNTESGMIITAEQEDTIAADGKNISILPAYKVMIENDLTKNPIE